LPAASTYTALLEIITVEPVWWTSGSSRLASAAVCVTDAVDEQVGTGAKDGGQLIRVGVVGRDESRARGG